MPSDFQSGIGIISGWVCEAERVEIEITDSLTGEGRLLKAASGTTREDTAEVCGDADNGFGLLWNWNLLGDGQHTVRALADGVEIGHSTFIVTTLGEEVKRGVSGTYTLEDFPEPGTTVTVEWRQERQNFTITGVE